MDESEDNLSAEDIKYVNSPTFLKTKSKKKSLVERELATSLTARVTSPLTNWESSSTSRYGRARRLKTEIESSDSEKSVTNVIKSPKFEKSPVRIQSPVYKMHASNSPLSMEKAKQSVTIENKLETQIENIYNENISLSRFGSDEKKIISPVKKLPKIYMRQDLIQSKEKDKEETITLIKNIFSPVKKINKSSTHIANILERSSEKYSLGTKHLDTLSVVKTLDFDGNKKKKKEIVDNKITLSKSEIFEIEAKCEYQVGDLAWARMGTYPFWPCIVTRDPESGTFVKKKSASDSTWRQADLLGRIERDILHVTFLGDNGRRGWIVENMLRKFLGQHEFETTREHFTSEEKKRDPRLYAAFFITEKKQPQWATSVEEAESLLREPKRLRIDILQDMLKNDKYSKITAKIEKRVKRTNSDVSLSESLYDTLFSEDDTKNNDNERSKSKTRNKSLDVSEVVTACLDNMAAKTGITKIQKQSHMDRWLQKAKSKTPEKSFFKSQTTLKTEKECKYPCTKQKPASNENWTKKSRNLRSRKESSDVIEIKLLSHQNEHDYSKRTYEELTKSDIVDKVDNIPLTQMNENSERTTLSESQDLTVTEQVVTETNDNRNNHDDNLSENNSIPLINGSVSSRLNDIESMQIDLNNKEVQHTKLAIVNGESLPSNKVDEDFLNKSEEDDIYLDQNEDFLGTSILERRIESVDTETGVGKNVDSKTNPEKDVQRNISKTNLENIQIKEVNELRYNYIKAAISDNDKSISVLDENLFETSSIESDSEVMNLPENGGNQDLEMEKPCTPICESTALNKTTEVVGIKDMDSNQPSESQKSEDSQESSDSRSLKDDDQLEENELLRDNYDNFSRDKPTKVVGTKDMDDNQPSESQKSEDSQESSDSRSLKDDDQLEENEFLRDNLDKFSRDKSKKVVGTKDMDDNQTSQRQKLESEDSEESSDSRSLNDEQIKENKVLQDNHDSRIKSKKEIGVKNMDDNQTSESQKSESEYSEESSDSRSLKGDEHLKEKVVLQDNHGKFPSNHVRSIQCNDNEVPNSLSSGYSSSIPEEPDDDHLINNLNDREISLKVNESIKNNPVSTEVKLSNSEMTCLPEVIRDNCDFSNTEPSNEKNFVDEVNIALDKNADVSEKHNNLAEGTELTEDEILSRKISNGLSDENNFTKIVNQEKSTSDKQSYKCSNSDVESLSSENTEYLSLNNPNSDLKDDGEAITNKNDVDFDDSRTSNWKIKEVIDSKSTLLMKLNRTVVKESIKLAKKELDDPEFLNYVELRQGALIDEHPELTQDEITNYLYKTWQYEESSKSESMKTDEIEHANLFKDLRQETTQPKRVRKKVKLDKEANDDEEFLIKPKSKRRKARPYYNEDNSDMDIESESELFEMFKTKGYKDKNNERLHSADENVEESRNDANYLSDDDFDQVEEYFKQLTTPKPNLFKGLVREGVCEICEKTSNLVKCKGCHSMFHVGCTKKGIEVIDKQLPAKGRKKKKRNRGRKQKGSDDSNNLDPDSQSDEKSQELNMSEENISIDDLESHIIVDANSFEAQLSEKMKEMLNTLENEYCSDSSENELDWSDTEVGKCKIIDIKLPIKNRDIAENSDFKCNNCVQYDKPVCFVCRAVTSPKDSIEYRQRCQLAHCHKYYHLECLEHWPQTQFNSGEAHRNNKKIKGFFEPVVCPRHVCHTCVSDDPRGCKTRFSGDKLARCIRCPATYHSFTKCLPAGTQILTASHIICPRHYEHRPGKVPCHVNTGWCFICALGGSLICCEYCPTSFHAECLNIKPPEGGYMCEDCETGCLPLYGEMVWVKLGHYRWWPGIILHPSEIPPNILAVKHSPGEFVVRFFGQYDHYWVNRGRVFPFQEGDTGKVSNQKSKIDAAFNMAMEHAQRACKILKKVAPNEQESPDFASSLLPPHYVKLKVNKPCGSLCGKRIDLEEGSLTQCECNPDEEDPCGPYSQCLNRMLLTECGPSCRAGDRCNNRAFEKRLYPKLVPYRTPQRGWGLKTLEDIKAGQFVIEYVGELIDEEEFKRRMQRKYEIRDENYYFLTLDKERMIDAGPKGNLARFMNHCCEPNCETQKWTVLGDVRVGLFALRHIPANSEVTFNYNLECAGIEKKQCLCGAKRCSGYIGAKPKQNDPQPKKNKKDVTTKRTYKKRKIVEYSPTTRPKPAKRQTSRSNPKELTEIEKDLLIIKQATNGISSDSDCSGRLSVESGKETRTLKRKRNLFSTEEHYNRQSRTSKRFKEDGD